jgi:HAD superfamily hydrolase (TIGR01662 family)
VVNVPYNTDPAAVEPVEGAQRALERLRGNGIRVGVVTNQSGVGRGRITSGELAAVNLRVAELLGPFDVWRQCLHTPGEDCGCRKPAPGLVTEACQQLGVSPGRTVVVGDIGSDVEAARAAGAVGVLVPTAATLRAEIAAADHVCPDLPSAVEAVLEGRW